MNIPQSFKQSKGFLAAGIPLFLAAILLSGFLWVLESVPPARALVSNQRAPIALGNDSVITIGVAADMSEFANWIGWRQVNAVQLAADKINAAGGVEIGGINYTLTLVSADSGCDPTQALSAANTLLNAGAVAVMGHTCSAASNAAQPLYMAAGVSMVSPSATWPPLTDQGYTTTFRVITRDDSPPAMLAAYMRNRLAYQRAAIVEMEGFVYNDWIKGVFSDTFTSLGGEITSHNTVSSTMDFTATLTTIMAENPDAIFFGHDDSGIAGLLSKVAHNLGMTDVAIGWATFSGERSVLDGYASTAGIAAEGDIAILHGRDTDNMPGYPDFNAAYVAAGFTNYGDGAQAWGAFAYDALQIIVAAIDRANSVNPEDIRDEIAATAHYQGVVGAYQGFDDKGDVIPQWAWMEQYQDGHWRVIWPYRVLLPLIRR